MIEVRKMNRARARGAIAGADAVRGAVCEMFAGTKRFVRVEFHSDNPSLEGRHHALSLGERLRLERWMLA